MNATNIPICTLKAGIANIAPLLLKFIQQIKCTVISWRKFGFHKNHINTYRSDEISDKNNIAETPTHPPDNPWIILAT